MEYDINTQEDIINAQITTTRNTLDPDEAFFHKRSVFLHEGEYRVLIKENSQYWMNMLASNGVKDKIEDAVRDKTDDEIIDYLTEKIYAYRMDWGHLQNMDVRLEDSSDGKDFIEGIMVHPKAEEWYVEIIRNICKETNINFEGRSTIYELQT